MNLTHRCAVTTVVAVMLVAPRLAAQSVPELVQQLTDAKNDEQAVAALVEHGEDAIPALVKMVRGGSTLAPRGWSVVAIARIPGAKADAALLQLQNDNELPAIVHTWAAAGRIARADSIDALAELWPLLNRYPALERPFQVRLATELSPAMSGRSAENLMSMYNTGPSFQQQAVTKAILTLPPVALVRIMVGSSDQSKRRQAAAFVATMAQNKGTESVARAVIAAYRFHPGAPSVPWSGGPLFIPGFSWPKAEATALVGELLAWHLYCDLRGLRRKQKQLENNLRTTGLSNASGYQPPMRPASTAAWLEVWAGHVGKGKVRRILAAQGVAKSSRYYEALRRY